MLSRILFSLFFLLRKSGSIRLSEEFQHFIKPHFSESASASLRLESYNSSFVAPLGWIQGIQYESTTCEGTSFSTTNIALGVCIQDGNSSSYIQYMLISAESNPTVYNFYIDTFSDSNCTTIISNVYYGTMDPNYVCYQDNTGEKMISKTVYYYPGTVLPPYPYNGVLTNYMSNNDTCSGTLLKTVILNPTTCYTNYNYNSSDLYRNFHSFTIQCNSEHPVINTLYLDYSCSVPASVNNTSYDDEKSVCQTATFFRKYPLPELYLLEDTGQFNYESAIATCYMGPTVFVHNNIVSEIYRNLQEYFEGVYNFIFYRP